MTNKIILTNEQAKDVEDYRLNYGETLGAFIQSSYAWKSTLANMSTDDFAKALYVGYEIEKPKVKVGEWATNTVCNQTFLVYAVTDKQVIRQEDAHHWDSGLLTQIRWYPQESMRQATEEEILWTKLGREVKEFHEGDVLLYTSRQDACVYVKNGESSVTDDWISIEEAKQWYEDGDFRGFYPAESYIKFNNKE